MFVDLVKSSPGEGLELEQRVETVSVEAHGLGLIGSQKVNTA
jgi:hypothetical protein